MDNVTRLLMQGAAGVSGDKTYIEDVFSTYLYKGSSSSGSGSGQAISNGIKLGNANAGSGVEFDASSSQYLKVPQHSSLELGTGDYCIECWVRPTASGSPNEGIWTYGSYDGNGGMLVWIHGNELKVFCARTNANICTSSNWRQQNAWTHLAVARYSGTTKTFSNGVEIGTSTEQNNDNVGEAANNMNQFFLGCERDNNNNIGGYFEGNISNMRIVKGSAVYTSNFTPPTKALTSTTNTLVLFCQSSTSATAATKTPITITSNGDPTASGFGPFTATDGEGGMVWLKARGMNGENCLSDTVNGAGKRINSDQNWAMSTSGESVAGFNNSGFTLPGGWNPAVNSSGQKYVSWTWRKAPGFFDIVTYTGTGSARTVSHNLESIPGCIMVKRTDASDEWVVYHRGISDQEGNNPGHYYLYLNTNNGRMGGSSRFNNTAATSTEFTVGTDNGTNANGGSYVAYVFAGGASTAATARSVYFQAGAEYLESSSSDYVLGTGDFTAELWFKTDDHTAIQRLFDKRTASNTSGGVLSIWQEHLYWHIDGSNGPIIGSGSCKIRRGQWYHAAVVRHSSTTKLYLNGEDVGTLSNDTTNYDTSAVRLGEAYNGGYGLNGNISNFRIVVGTALYTSSFKPPTEPLTSITNTKLLCCNNSSVTGKTTGATITASGTLVASTDSPFDDPEGFKFGGDEDQNIVKTGSYVGNGNTDGPEVYLGWEPQWVLIKNASANEGWRLFDSMRGIATDGVDARLFPNNSDAESAADDYIDLTPTGFKLKDNGGAENGNDNTMTYIAIRRPDGYVAKPPEAGTDAFAMDTGNGNSNIPNFDANFPVDFGLARELASTWAWQTGARLIGGNMLNTNSSNVEGQPNGWTWDSNAGWLSDSSFDSDFQSWMWKRGAGFDVVTWAGNNTSVVRNHSLGRTPEMIWYKCRSSTRNWRVYHKGLNGGTNPEDYAIQLNSQSPESSNTNYMTGTAPTSTSFVAGNDDDTNGSGKTYIAMLFASVAGISKVDSYTGNGSSQTITTGFSPRFVIIRRADGSQDNWVVLDTTRGWAAGNDNYISLNLNNAQTSGDMGAPTSTGFTLTSDGWVNHNTGNFIYYAHA